MARIVDINYNNDLHIKIIKKLSKKNNFHIEDVYGVCGDLKYGLDKRTSIYEKLNIEIEKKFYIEMEKKFYKNNSNYKGLIICKEKKPVGFLLYYIRPHNCSCLDIEFLLIDKNEQKNGFGTKLIDHIKQKYENYVIVVKSDNDNSNKWYIHKGFLTDSQYFSKIREKYPRPELASDDDNMVIANYFKDKMNKVNRIRFYYKKLFK
jgi:ribosomal protein S18 acetylase RimI-like enzyme